MSSIKEIIKALLPSPAVQAIQNHKLKKHREKYRDLTTEQVFTKVYEDGAWGKSKDPSQKFFSGSGSHDSFIVRTYIEAVHNLLYSFKKKPDVVDLGCGDFFVGSNIRSLCDKYTACDIVQPLIDFNKEKYKSLNVDFRVLDLTKDELPQADIVFVRQVLQHLSNEQIKNALPQISSKYRYLVLTEHLPATGFIKNLDKPAGPDIRLDVDSGIVLTSQPFSLQVKEERQLCQASEDGGLIKTILYKL